MSALRLAEKGYSRRGARARPALRRRRVAAIDLGRPPLLLERRGSGCGDLPAVDVQGRDDRARAAASAAAASATRTRSTVPPGRFFKDPQWGELGDWEAELAPHYDDGRSGCSASSTTTHDDPADELLRELGEEIGVADTYRHDPRRRLLRRAGQDGARPVLRRRGARAHRLHALRRCMVGCPHGAKNTLVKNYLYLAERARRRGHARPRGRRRRAARRSRRRRGYAVVDRAPGARVAPASAERCTRPRRRPRGGRARHQRLLRAAATAARCRSSRPRSASCVRTNSEAILAVTADDSRRLQPARRDHLVASTPTPHPHRDRDLRRGGARCGCSTRCWPATARARHGRSSCSAQLLRHPLRFAQAAVAARLVAAHDHPAGDADARQRDRAARRRTPRRPCPAADRAGPRAAEPDLHPGRQPGGASGSPSGPAASPRARSRRPR